MKASRLRQPKPFEPVEILLTFENENEAGVFRAIFNYSPVTDSIKSVAPTFNDDVIREVLSDYGGGMYWNNFKDGLERRLKK
jgi:hypothetical protein